jgi:predicted N-acetyltransferase YhbS
LGLAHQSIHSTKDTSLSRRFRANFRQGIRRRLYDAKSLSLVACLASEPSKVVGYGQFSRLGDDEGVKVYHNSRGTWNTLLLLVLSWLFWAYDKIANTIWPDRSSDMEALKIFEASVAADSQTYWKSHPERSSRWHAQSIIVSPEWQGKGIGILLVADVLSRAQGEGVMVGLSASPAGEKLYRRMGFQLLGDFTFRLTGDEGRGIMICYPEAKQKSRD